MMRAIKWLLAGTVLSSLLLAAAPVDGFPAPALVPRSWELTFTHQQPRPIAVKRLNGTTAWYWYMPYKVVNNSKQELNWIPEILITTDRGHTVVAGRNVSANVFAAIKEKEGNPLLDHPDNVVGKILIGEDYARESVAIWPAFDEDVDKLTIFVAGTSGETAVIEDPADAEKEIVLRKNYMVEYEVPGTEEHPQKQSVKKLDSGWVMR